MPDSNFSIVDDLRDRMDRITERWERPDRYKVVRLTAKNLLREIEKERRAGA